MGEEGVGALCDPGRLVLEAEGTAPAGKVGRWGWLARLCGTCVQ